MTEKRWWLLSDADVCIIRTALRAPEHEANDDNCEEWWTGTKCQGCVGEELRRQAVDVLDTGLHRTDALPADMVADMVK